MYFHNLNLAIACTQAEANKAGYPRYIVREDRTADDRGIIFIVHNYPAAGEIVATLEPR